MNTNTNRQLASGEQAISLSQLRRSRVPDVMLADLVRTADLKMREAMRLADLVADPDDAMVTVRVETIAIPREGAS